MADITNLTQFLSDIASAIRTKRDLVDAIPAKNFDTEILNITTGISTDDATATEDDVISPKTFYAQGVKKTGGILAEYAHLDTSASVYNRQVTSSNNIAISTPYNILVEWVSNYVYFHKINADNTLTQLTKYSCSFNTFHTISIAQTLINNNELVVWVGGIGRVQNVYRMGRLYCLYFNMDTYEITSASVDLSSDIAPYHIVINPVNPNIIAGMNGYSYTSSYLSYRCLNRSTISGTGLYGKMNAYYDAEWSSDGKYLLAYTNGVKPGASKSLFTCDPTALTVSTSGTSKSYTPMCLYNDKYYITKTAFRSLTTDALVKSITEIPNATFLWTWKDILFAHDGSNLSAYIINNDLSLTLITTLQSVGSISSTNAVSILRPMSNESGWFKIGSLLYMCNVKEGEYAITKAIIKDRDYVLLPASLDNTTSADVLNNKAFINSNGLQYGTMPNRGAITYTPSTTSQTIADGYHKGSTIRAVTSSIDSDIKSTNIKRGVDILGVSGLLANCITFATVEEMNNYTGEEDMYAIVYGTTYVGTYRYDNGSWTQIGDSSQEQQIMDVLNEIIETTDQYEGVGGTDEEVNLVLDNILGEGGSV